MRAGVDGAAMEGQRVFQRVVISQVTEMKKLRSNGVTPLFRRVCIDPLQACNTVAFIHGIEQESLTGSQRRETRLR